MSPSNFFRTAAEGSVPQQGRFVAGMVMGKNLFLEGLEAVVSTLGLGVVHGSVNVSNVAVAAKAAHVDIVESPKYMAQRPDVTTRYNPNTEGLFGTEEKKPGPPALV